MREVLLERWYRPFREAVRADLETVVARRGTVLHLSVHSFTPRLGGELRDYDVGILYDPARPAERAFAGAWRDALAEAGLTVRRNQPYRGNADGHTTSLRRVFPDSRYQGIELELNQARLIEDRFPPAIVTTVLACLASARA
jgi:predicted N-formylglutamate amidohydrolase